MSKDHLPIPPHLGLYCQLHVLLWCQCGASWMTLPPTSCRLFGEHIWVQPCGWKPAWRTTDPCLTTLRHVKGPLIYSTTAAAHLRMADPSHLPWLQTSLWYCCRVGHDQIYHPRASNSHSSRGQTEPTVSGSTYSPAPLHMWWPAVPLSALEGGQPHWYEYIFLLGAALIGL